MLKQAHRMARHGRQEEEARRAARCRRRLGELHADRLALEARLRALQLPEGKACGAAARRQLDQASRAIGALSRHGAVQVLFAFS